MNWACCMLPFTIEHGHLQCEQIRLADLAAEYGTPLWVYSKAVTVHSLGSSEGAGWPARWAWTAAVR